VAPAAAVLSARARARAQRTIVGVAAALAVLLSPCAALADESLSPELVKTFEEWLVRQVDICAELTSYADF
jgi:hypothetical protein